jgi:hypothetical protein
VLPAVVVLDQPIVEPLVISLTVIMGEIILGCVSQRSLAEQNQPIETFVFMDFTHLSAKEFKLGERLGK